MLKTIKNLSPEEFESQKHPFLLKDYQQLLVLNS